MNNDELKQRVALAANLAALEAAEHEWDVYAQLRGVKELETKAGKPYLVLTGKGERTREDPELPETVEVFADLAAVVDHLTLGGEPS